MIVATAGHVDHGKTQLVKRLTGIDTDRLAEEKQRGLTIDLGFAYLPADDDTVLGFVDVPGHIRFIGNMLAGVAGIDCALLVVAADDGVMPQTREHLAILHLLRITRGAVAVTKIDRVESDRVDQVTEECRELLRDTHLANAPIFPVCSPTGEGVESLRDALFALARARREREADGHFRLAIDRCFTLTGAGVVVTGAVFAGTVTTGDELMVSPTGIPVRVRRIDAQNRTADEGRAGQRCAVNLSGPGLRREEIHRGDWLLHPALHGPTDRFDARIDLLPSEERALRHWTPVHIHIGASDITGRVALLDRDAIAPGESGLVQLITEKSIGAWRSDRLILRDQAAMRTIGGGIVLDPYSPRRGRARPARIRQLHALEGDPPEEVARQLLAQSPNGLNLSNLFRSCNLLPERQRALLEALDARAVALDSEGLSYLVGFSAEHWSAAREHVVRSLANWHDSHPESLGPSDKQLRSTLRPLPPLEVFAALVEETIGAGSICRSGSRLHLPGHAATMSGEDRTLWELAAPLLEESELKPPVVHDLARSLRVPPRTLERFLNRAAQLGLVVRVAENRYFLPDQVRALGRHAAAVAGEEEEGLFTASQYRDRTAIGRNLAIEVLEYFDRLGLTRREGDRRRMVRPVDEVL